MFVCLCFTTRALAPLNHGLCALHQRQKHIAPWRRCCTAVAVRPTTMAPYRCAAVHVPVPQHPHRHVADATTTTTTTTTAADAAAAAAAVPPPYRRYRRYRAVVAVVAEPPACLLRLGATTTVAEPPLSRNYSNAAEPRSCRQSRRHIRLVPSCTLRRSTFRVCIIAPPPCTCPSPTLCAAYHCSSSLEVQWEPREKTLTRRLRPFGVAVMMQRFRIHF